MIFFDSQKLINNVILDIENAVHSIDIEVYIWDPDAIGSLFEEALAKAAARGVKVRVIVDRIGSFSWITSRMSEFAGKGVEVRVFRPLLSIQTVFKLFPKSFYTILDSLNRRNHRKTFIIDKKTVYIGSFNIMQPALKWKEITIREDDPEIARLTSYIFECTWDWLKNMGHWYKKYDFNLLISEVLKSDIITTTQTKILRKQYTLDLLKKINKVQKKLWFVTPYFNPPGFLLKALASAAKKGVDVRIMVPLHTDPKWFKFLSRLYYSHLLKRKIKIYEYEPGILHAKAAIFDDECSIGSGNLNYRSFYRDLELNLLITKSEDVKDLKNEFISDMAKSKEITAPNEIKMWERVFGSFLTIFKTSF